MPQRNGRCAECCRQRRSSLEASRDGARLGRSTRQQRGTSLCCLRPLTSKTEARLRTRRGQGGSRRAPHNDHHWQNHHRPCQTVNLRRGIACTSTARAHAPPPPSQRDQRSSPRSMLGVDAFQMQAQTTPHTRLGGWVHPSACPPALRPSCRMTGVSRRQLAYGRGADRTPPGAVPEAAVLPRKVLSGDSSAALTPQSQRTRFTCVPRASVSYKMF